jgi:rhodanese-related sulfurtransferase
MVATISPEQLNTRLQNGGVELIDVRTPAEFRQLHLRNARNVPLERLDPDQLCADRRERAQREVFLVCHSGSRGKLACERLAAAGWERVVNVEGGTAACAKAGLDVVHGKKMISLERQVRIAAGSLAFVGGLLALIVDPSFAALPAFVGGGLVFAGVTDTCGMGMLLARMPWNQVAEDAACTASTT